MNRKRNSTEGGWSELKWFLLVVVGVWILWFYTGGPERAQITGDDPFMRALDPIDTGETYGGNRSR